MNIDNGFGAGHLAGLINRQSSQYTTPQQVEPRRGLEHELTLQPGDVSTENDHILPNELAKKLARLEEILRQLGSVALGFSGGIDSSLVAWVGGRVLGERLLAVTIRSPVESPEETELAIQFAKEAGLRHLVVDVDDLADPKFSSNPPDRCYHCKLRRFGALRQLADQEGLNAIVDGSNTDDAGVYRPGRKAIQELGVVSPLSLAGLNKADIRQLAKALGLPNWDKPAAPCLATRFPYNTQLTRAEIDQVGKAESYLHRLGFRTARVRYENNIARIEVEPAAFPITDQP